ncbi:hypothetical protein STEG23_018313 [Scotinomys teguina]
MSFESCDMYVSFGISIEVRAVEWRLLEEKAVKLEDGDQGAPRQSVTWTTFSGSIYLLMDTYLNPFRCFCE